MPHAAPHAADHARLASLVPNAPTPLDARDLGRAPAPAGAPLPARVTLRAPAAMPYAALLGALTAARARGVRRATVVVEL